MFVSCLHLCGAHFIQILFSSGLYKDNLESHNQEWMSKNKKGRKATVAVSEPAARAAARSSQPESSISKAQKRKLQKKRAKQKQKEEREAEDKARVELKAQKAAKAATAQTSEPHPPPPPLAFAAEEDDHCETAPQAFADITQLLVLLAERIDKTAATLRIYVRSHHAL
jgi:ATPase subunit of ABC transporter with duplicated ATPase domains